MDRLNALTAQPHGNLQRRKVLAREMAYRERWQAEIAELQKILSGFDLKEARKWGKPCYTLDAPKTDNP